MTPTLSTHRPWYRRLLTDVRDHWHQQRTLQALRELDSRTLADIGIGASELSSIDSEARGLGDVTRRRIVRELYRA
jgi:uncharacterized protein YjiS (DUF1127 family)